MGTNYIKISRFIYLIIFAMPFNPESARKASSKIKRGPTKYVPVKTQMMLLFENLIQDLIKNKEKLSIQ
jgi:hypothetical protein